MSQYQDPKKPECDEDEAYVDNNGYYHVARYPAWLQNYLDYKKWKDGLEDTPDEQTAEKET